MNIHDIEDFTGTGDPTVLIPHFGTSYTDQNALKEIVTMLDGWQFRSALDKLDSLIDREDELIDALLLKGEILAHFDLNEDAAAVFKQVLQIDSENPYAEMMLIIQLSTLKSEAELEPYTKRLEKRFPEMFALYERIMVLIEENHNRFEFPGITDPIEVICVFGFGVNDDGTLPDVLEKRLLKVEEIAELHPSAVILVSGGGVKNKYNEAIEMKKYLVGRDVDEQRIVTLEHAKDTVGNVIEFVDYIQAIQLKHICAVTSKAHLPRAWMTLKLALDRLNNDTCLSGTSPEEEVSASMMELEHKLNYQTLFRIAGLFEKKDIDAQLLREARNHESERIADR